MEINFKKYRLVESNVYDIPVRLKEIDQGYFILLNRKTGKYEVHNSNQIGSTYCLTVTHEELDSRTIDMVQQQIRQDNDKLIAEIEEHNAKLEAERMKKYTDEVNDISSDIYKFGNKTCRDVEHL